MINRRRLHRAYAQSGFSDTFFDTLTERDMRRAGMVGWVSRVGGGGGEAKEKKVSQKRPVMFEVGMMDGEENEKVGVKDGETSIPGGSGKGKDLGSRGWEGIKVSYHITLRHHLHLSPRSPLRILIN